jgi:hypothetical protein
MNDDSNSSWLAGPKFITTVPWRDPLNKPLGPKRLVSTSGLAAGCEDGLGPSVISPSLARAMPCDPVH